MKYFKVTVSRTFVAILSAVLDLPFLWEPPLQGVKAWLLNTLLRAKIARSAVVAAGVRSTNWRNVTVGDRAYIATGVDFRAHDEIHVGRYSTIGPGVMLAAGGHDAIDLSPTAAPIRVGEGVFIGARAIVLAGASIGDHAIVGAGALVNGDVPAFSIVAGVPARVVGQRERPTRVWTVRGHLELNG